MPPLDSIPLGEIDRVSERIILVEGEVGFSEEYVSVSDIVERSRALTVERLGAYYEQLNADIQSIRAEAGGQVLGMEEIVKQSRAFISLQALTGWSSQKILEMSPEAVPMQVVSESCGKQLGDYVEPLLALAREEEVTEININWIKKRYSALIEWIRRRRQDDSNTENPYWVKLKEICLQNGVELDINSSPKCPTFEERVEMITEHLRGLDGFWGATMAFTHEDNKTYHTKILREHYNVGQGVVWSVFLDKLPKDVANRFLYRSDNPELFEAYPSEKNLYVKCRTRYLQVRLKEILDEKDPESFNAKWIFREASGVFKNLRKVRKYDHNFSWTEFIDGVGGGWLDKFTGKTVKKGESTPDGEDLKDGRTHKKEYVSARRLVLQAKLREIIGTEKPRRITLDWLKQCKNAGYLGSAVMALMNLDGEMTWEEFVEDAIDSSTRATTTEGRIDMITQSLLGYDGEYWSPVTAMAHNGNKLYHKDVLLKGYGSEHGIRWEQVLKELPDEVAKKFHYVRENSALFEEYPQEARLYVISRTRYLKERLREILKEKNPESFNAKWMAREAPGVLQGIKRIQKYDPDFSSYTLVRKLGGGWLDIFESRFEKKDGPTLKGDALRDYQAQKTRYIGERKQVLQERLAKILEVKKRRNITLAWLKKCKDAGNLASAISSFMKLDENMTWEEFVEEAFDLIPGQLTFADRIDMITQNLLDHDGDFWIPSNIFRHKGCHYYHKHAISRKYGSEHGIRWSLLLKTLPVPIAKKFHYAIENPELFEAYPEERDLYFLSKMRYLQAHLREIFERKNPAVINTRWLRAHAGGAWKGICEIKKHVANFSWYGFIREMGGVWIDRFECRFISNDESQLAGVHLGDYLNQKKKYVSERKKALQDRLRVILETEKPDQFTPTWLGECKNAGVLSDAIASLIKFDGGMTWIRFVKELGGGWIDKFDCHCYSTEDHLDKMQLVLERDQVEKWSIALLTTKYRNTLGSAIQKHLKKSGLNWQDLLDCVSPELIERYDYTKDGEDGHRNRAEVRKQARLTTLGMQIDQLIGSRDLSEWSIETLKELAPHLRRTLKDDRRRRISDVIPYLSEKTLLSFRSDNFVLKYHVLAERVRRDLGESAVKGWKLLDIKDPELRQEVEALGDKVELVIKHLPSEIKCAFSRNNRAMNMSRIRVGNVLDNGGDDTERVDRILDVTRYSETGEISYRLCVELRAEIVRGNRYAVMITDSILEAYLSSANVHIAAKRGNMSEILFQIKEGDDIHMQMVRMAYRLSRENRTISIDAPRGRGEWREWTLHDSIQTATTL